MSTFKISQPSVVESNFENQQDLTVMFNDFKNFMSDCGYKVESIDQVTGENNYVVCLSGDKLMNIEAIVGKKYIRLMDKRLNPTVTSQITYDKDLDFKKYKANIDSIVGSIKSFSQQELRIVALIDELLKIETADAISKYMPKYGIDNMAVVDGEVHFIKKIDEVTEIIVSLSNSGNKFHFSVKYPINERFNLLNNFLPEDNYAPKMSGINGRIEEYNKIAGEIIQKIIGDEKNE